MNKEDLKQGEWYWFNSTYKWIIKFDKIENKYLYFTKYSTPNDGYVGKNQKRDPFLIKDFTQFSPIEDMEIVYKLFPEERPKSKLSNKYLKGRWVKCISDSVPCGQWNNEKIGDYFQITDDKGVTEETLSNKIVCLYVNDKPMDPGRIWKHKQFELMPEGWQKSIPTPVKEENMENRPEYVKCIASNDSPSNWTIDKVYKTQPNGIISDEGYDYNKPSYDKFIEWISGWGVMFKPATEAEYLAQQYPKSLFTKPKFKIGDEVKVCRKEEDKNRWGYLKNNDTTEQIAALGGRRGKILERKIHNGRNYYRIDLFFISEDCLTPVNVVPEPSFEKIPILDINGQYVGGYDPYLVEEMKTFFEDYKVVQKSPKNKINECVNKVKSIEVKLIQPKKVVYF